MQGAVTVILNLASALLSGYFDDQALITPD
jgi:hypothetical protein